MSMNVNNMSGGGGGDYGNPQLGQHYARLIGFVYLGVQERQPYKGEKKDPCGQALLTFELLDDFCEIDGEQRPRWVSKRVNTFNSQNASIVKIYNAIDPTGQFGGDFGELVKSTAPCMVTIAQKQDMQGNPVDGTKVGSIASVPKAPDGSEYQLNPAQNPYVLFDFDDPTLESYASLKNWMRQEVKKGVDFPGSAAERVAQQFEAQNQDQTQAAPAQAQAASPASSGSVAQPATVAANQAPPPAQAPVAQPAAQTPPPAAPPPAQQPAPPAAPVAQQAPAQSVPAAPPGFRYDQATNSFVPDGGGNPGTPY